ncbi:glycoside hydrolase family 30 beta sandwich domain-containing protein [Lentzea sp. NPDC058450]|uniref:glycoside hydrolase family 30 beta sandwich domain-containing protein n=1 Tax=Lentzea sp. NPDC058450 TaxID=3346505 RepID=UPI00364E6BA0
MSRSALMCCCAATMVLMASAPSVSAPGVPDTRPIPDADTGRTVHVTLTTADLSEALGRQPGVGLAAPDPNADITLDDSVPLQVMDGFGASFTDSSTRLIDSLRGSARARAMRDLFSRDSGIGLSFMRAPMGASDYSATPLSRPRAWSYDDNNGEPDPELRRFSINHDREYTIPVIKEAYRLNAGMKLYTSPWSPPAWMKTNDSMVPLGTEPGTLLKAHYPTLAQYFVKFLKEYRRAGVPVWGVTPQNEPSVTPGGYPGMRMSATQSAEFVGGHLGPALKKAGLDTKIIAVDDNPNVDYARTFYGDARARAFTYGYAGHCYGGNIEDFARITGEFPQRSYMSECSPKPRGIAPMNTAELAIRSTNSGVSGIDLWNLALNPAGGPKMGAGCTDCDGLLTINPDGSYTPTLSFFQLGQFSKFVDPEARHVRTTTRPDLGLHATGYRNPGGNSVLVVTNTGNQPKSFTTSWNKRGSFGYTLAAGATATFNSGGERVFERPRNTPITTMYNVNGTGLNQWDLQPAGAWGQGDGNAYSAQAGATATLKFEGTGISLYAFPHDLNGFVTISVDGGPAKTIDLSADPSRNPTLIASFTGLQRGPHTLVETVTGRTGSSGRGTYGSLIAAVNVAG